MPIWRTDATHKAMNARRLQAGDRQVAKRLAVAVSGVAGLGVAEREDSAECARRRLLGGIERLEVLQREARGRVASQSQRAAQERNATRADEQLVVVNVQKVAHAVGASAPQRIGDEEKSTLCCCVACEQAAGE
eukprot:5736004-Prymnesium_polylepis.1